jgi:hypothetical protein
MRMPGSLERALAISKAAYSPDRRKGARTVIDLGVEKTASALTTNVHRVTRP